MALMHILKKGWQSWTGIRLRNCNLKYVPYDLALAVKKFSVCCFNAWATSQILVLIKSCISCNSDSEICTGNKTENPSIDHESSWRRTICSSFPCTTINITSIFHLCCCIAWHWSLQCYREGKKQAVGAWKFTESAYRRGNAVLNWNSHRGGKKKKKKTSKKMEEIQHSYVLNPPFSQNARV